MLTISTTHQPATDLGFMLHKNPAAIHSIEMSFGAVHVVYPESSSKVCTAAVIVEVDPVGLVRDRKGPKGNEFSLGQYVNDRPYAASSFLSVAINKLFSTAMSGRSKERQELADTPIPVIAHLPVVPCRGGEVILRRLFGPLGYEVDASPIPLDAAFPQWGASQYLGVTLSGTVRLRDLLEHLFVLLPALDDGKHYWVGADEVDKLLRRGGDWLGTHPDRELITSRYLRHDRQLANEALTRLLLDEPGDPDEEAAARDAEEAIVEQPISLSEQRLTVTLDQLKASGARRIIDLGCAATRPYRRQPGSTGPSASTRGVCSAGS